MISLIVPTIVPATAGEMTRISANPSDIRLWSSMLARLTPERAEIAACDADAAKCPNDGVRKWRTMIKSLRGANRTEQLAAVNLFANRMVAYREDSQDYWSTPVETLARGSGDCEDYAILKYFSLRELGFSDSQLQIVILYDRGRQLGHAVLSVGSRAVLDNMTDQINSQLPSGFSTKYTVNSSSAMIYIASAGS